MCVSTDLCKWHRIAHFTGTYAIAVGYCVTDVAYETYKCQQRGYKSEKGDPMSLTQVSTYTHEKCDGKIDNN